MLRPRPRYSLGAVSVGLTDGYACRAARDSNGQRIYICVGNGTAHAVYVRLQTALSALSGALHESSFDPGPVDGIVGRATAAAAQSAALALQGPELSPWTYTRADGTVVHPHTTESSALAAVAGAVGDHDLINATAQNADNLATYFERTTGLTVQDSTHPPNAAHDAQAKAADNIHKTPGAPGGSLSQRDAFHNVRVQTDTAAHETAVGQATDGTQGGVVHPPAAGPPPAAPPADASGTPAPVPEPSHLWRNVGIGTALTALVVGAVAWSRSQHRKRVAMSGVG